MTWFDGSSFCDELVQYRFASSKDCILVAALAREAEYELSFLKGLVGMEPLLSALPLEAGLTGDPITLVVNRLFMVGAEVIVGLFLREGGGRLCSRDSVATLEARVADSSRIPLSGLALALAG